MIWSSHWSSVHSTNPCSTAEFTARQALNWVGFRANGSHLHRTFSQWCGATANSQWNLSLWGRCSPWRSMCPQSSMDISLWKEPVEGQSLSLWQSIRWIWTLHHTLSEGFFQKVLHRGLLSSTTWFQWWWRLPTQLSDFLGHNVGSNRCTWIVPWFHVEADSLHTFNQTWSSIGRCH